MAAEIAARNAEGWEVDGDGRYGFVFCQRSGVRHMLDIVQVDPAEPVAGAYAAQSATLLAVPCRLEAGASDIVRPTHVSVRCFC